jgi:fatty-acyl-CoA synthase
VLPATVDALLGPADRPVSLPTPRPGDPAQIQYTSGTTGFPKGALLAHDGLALNGWLFAEAIGARPADRWVNPMPLFHTAGCGLVTLGALQSGGTQILPPRFDAELVLDLFERYRGTNLLSVPTMLIRILEAQARQPRDLGSWRLAALGGAPVPTELVRRAMSDLKVSVGIGFGQTEASPYMTHTAVDDPHPTWFATIGRPLPGIEVKIVHPETGSTAPLHEVGEICTRSRCVMLGYFDDPVATEKAIDGDGWLHTGDLGAMDEHGYLTVEGRLRDMIIRGGENIYPREVEEVLHQHPSVSNVAVVGIPDPEYGEAVAAFVQLRTGSGEQAADLADHCRRRLAHFKVPSVWRFVSEFPQTVSGKIQKFALRDEYVAGSTGDETGGELR